MRRPPAAAGNYVTSAFVREALDKGAELFSWEEKKARSGKRVGTKVRGVGVAISTYSAGSIGFDGLLVIRPDGRVQFQSGIGNLGTALDHATCTGSPPKSSACRGSSAKWYGATPASTCPGPARRAAARRRMR